MEGPIGWHRRARLLLHWTKFLAIHLCLCYRGLDLLLRHQCRHTTAHSQRWVRGQLMGYRYSTTVLQNRVNLHIIGCDLVRDQV
jgi:hypothetical protein